VVSRSRWGSNAVRLARSRSPPPAAERQSARVCAAPSHEALQSAVSASETISRRITVQWGATPPQWAPEKQKNPEKPCGLSGFLLRAQTRHRRTVGTVSPEGTLANAPAAGLDFPPSTCSALVGHRQAPLSSWRTTTEPCDSVEARAPLPAGHFQRGGLASRSLGRRPPRVKGLGASVGAIRKTRV
jgi:hypothetical protein